MRVSARSWQALRLLVMTVVLLLAWTWGWTLMANSHVRPAPAFGQHPDARRGMAGTMPLGQQRKIYGSMAGVARSSDSSDIGDASGGPVQSATGAGGYSSVGGGIAGSSAPAPAGAAPTPPGVPTTSTSASPLAPHPLSSAEAQALISSLYTGGALDNPTATTGGITGPSGTVTGTAGGNRTSIPI